MRESTHTAAVEDYLRALYKLEESGSEGTTTALARSVGVAPASATAMLKRLEGLGLVERLPYRAARLTAAGRRAALRVTRTHRLLERYLAETLDVPITHVHDEADRLEHTLSPELGDRLDELLGRPTHDPHGHPIPSADLSPGWEVMRTLDQVEAGEETTVRQVPDDDPALLDYLARINIVPGEAVTVTAFGPFDGPVTVRTRIGDVAISRALASVVRVTDSPGS